MYPARWNSPSQRRMMLGGMRGEGWERVKDRQFLQIKGNYLDGMKKKENLIYGCETRSAAVCV